MPMLGGMNFKIQRCLNRVFKTIPARKITHITDSKKKEMIMDKDD